MIEAKKWALPSDLTVLEGDLLDKIKQGRALVNTGKNFRINVKKIFYSGGLKTQVKFGKKQIPLCPHFETSLIDGRRAFSTMLENYLETCQKF